MRRSETKISSPPLTFDRELLCNFLKPWVPVPEGYAARSVQEAWKTASRLGPPLLLRPLQSTSPYKARVLHKVSEDDFLGMNFEGQMWIERYVSGNILSAQIRHNRLVRVMTRSQDLTSQVSADWAFWLVLVVRLLGLYEADLDFVASDISGLVDFARDFFLDVESIKPACDLLRCQPRLDLDWPPTDLKSRVVLGPNLWNERPVLEAKFQGLSREAAEYTMRTALDLQMQAGCLVSFGLINKESDSVWSMVFEVCSEVVGRKALSLALSIMKGDQDWMRHAETLRHLYQRVRREDQEALEEAARQQSIPAWKTSLDSPLLYLGWGSQLVRHVSGISGHLETNLLAPRRRTVQTVDEAWAAALEFGLPVILRSGDGVAHLDLDSSEKVLEAFRKSFEVVVEETIPGQSYRFLVQGDALLMAVCLSPLSVIGNGKDRLRDLIPDQAEVEEAAIRRRGFGLDSVPAAGEVVQLSTRARRRTGATRSDVTSEVHPDIAQKVRQATQELGLSLCSVSVVCESIREPFLAQRGAIISLNPFPDLQMFAPALRHLIPAQGRIPVVGVTGNNGKTTTTSLIAHLLRYRWQVGMTNTTGLYVNGRRLQVGDLAGPESARLVLTHPDVEAGVFECAMGGICQGGLGFDACSVAVVTNIGRGDHLGRHSERSLDEIVRIKGVLVRSVSSSGTAVLNADDQRVLGMARLCRGRLLLFSRAGPRPSGERVLSVENGDIVAWSNEVMVQRIPLRSIPFTYDGALRFEVENAMAAIGAAWALEVPWPLICQGLSTFRSDRWTVPGRFNIFKLRGATVIADYGHNVDGVRALVDCLPSFPATSRSLVMSAAGDRSDDRIKELARVMSGYFKLVVLYQDTCARGRMPGEVTGILQQEFAGESTIQELAIIEDELQAVEYVTSRLRDTELGVLLVDRIEEVLEQLEAACWAA